MSTTNKPFALQGAAHTAGIFADHSVDGPIIGTLVAVVDRAKNLPNRKTIGKQDPYCAARLGKEAKKTTTDIRGGQTPKWDQELRFVVHDSADYYQLKVSVFTDDKRTDLIGEAWIDLRNIIISGGGQRDVWQSLSCKGKYAGEIRMEITFYDSRPKPERTPIKAKLPTAPEVDVVVAASTRQRSPTKRRPLPSDPVTGEVPVSSVASGPSAAEYYPQQTPPRHHLRHPSHSGLIPTQSPLQSVEYGTPPATRSQQQHADVYGSSPQSAQAYPNTPNRQSNRSREQFETPPPPPRQQQQHHQTQQANQQPPPQNDWDYNDAAYDHGAVDPARRHYSPAADRHEPALRESPRNLPALDCDQPPPPPPAHRSRQSSIGPDTSPQKTASALSMRQDVLRNEAIRQASSAPVAVHHQPAPPQMPSPGSPHSPMQYDRQQHARHQSYDAAYDSPTRRGYSDEMHMDNEPNHPDPYSRSPGRSPGHMMGQDRGDPRAASRYDEPIDYQHYAAPQQTQSARRASYRDEYEASHSPGYGLPAPPSTLSHSVDPRLTRDISERVYEERRYDDRQYQQQNVSGRGRQYSEPPPSYNGAHTPQQQYERRGTGSSFSGSPQVSQQPVHQRQFSTSPSPNPHHRIQRKSVSPAPPPTAAAAEPRRLSDIPFGPDSYDALNPSLISSRSSNSGTPALENRDHNGKIISHDGREIDPSDHLPMETWAPEPEPRPSSKQASPEPRARPSPGGAQPMPSSGRNRAGRSGRPDPVATQHSYGHSEQPQTPTGAGRNRLQKKGHRSSTAVSPAASSPLAPMDPDQYHDNRHSPYSSSSRHAPRGSHYDYPNENHAPSYGNGPPIPAKIPMYSMSGGNGDEASNLMEEMQKIDIGNGRSRRRGGY